MRLTWLIEVRQESNDHLLATLASLEEQALPCPVLVLASSERGREFLRYLTPGFPPPYTGRTAGGLPISILGFAEEASWSSRRNTALRLIQEHTDSFALLRAGDHAEAQAAQTLVDLLEEDPAVRAVYSDVILGYPDHRLRLWLEPHSRERELLHPVTPPLVAYRLSSQVRYRSDAGGLEEYALLLSESQKGVILHHPHPLLLCYPREEPTGQKRQRLLEEIVRHVQ